jgi:hypothetical protein
MKAHEVLKETGMIHEGPHDPYYRKKVDGTLTKFRKRDDFNEGPEQFLHVTGRQWLPWKEINKTEMVQAKYCGRKTQTRRTKGLDAINIAPEMWRFIGFDDTGQACFESDEIKGVKVSCPFGQKGDGLWVRETFAIESNNGYQDIYQKPDNPMGPVRWPEPDDFETKYFECPRYKASEPDTILGDDEDGMKWKPSIHMPRWACRTVLEIINIRIERLQDISEHDADAEGVYREWDGSHLWYKNYLQNSLCKGHPENRAKNSFFTLWESINGKSGMGWEHNPWLWVIEFKQGESI